MAPKTRLNFPAMNKNVIYLIDDIAESEDYPPRIIQRAKIIKHLLAGDKIFEAAKKADIQKNKVSKWKKKFIENADEINRLGEANEIEECKEKIIKTLSDKQRPGRRKKFNEADENLVIELYNTSPSDPSIGLDLENWSYQILADYLSENQLLSGSISKPTVEKIIKEHYSKFD